jgi:hypothetical protein
VIALPIVQVAALAAALFQPVAADLKRTSVPVLLPAVVPEAAHETVFVAAEVSRRKYDVEIAFAPGCRTATACHLGDVTGERATASTEGVPVRLRDGTPARYDAARCGASCGDGRLSWNRGPYRYTVAIKAGSLQHLKTWAESMVRVP